MSEQEEKKEVKDFFTLISDGIKCNICDSIYIHSPNKNVISHLNQHVNVVITNEFLYYYLLQHFEKCDDGFKCKYCNQKFFLLTLKLHLKYQHHIDL